MMGIVISKEGQKKKGGGSSGENKQKKKKKEEEEFSKREKSIPSVDENWVALLGTYKMWLFSCKQYWKFQP